ncbi:hypothetical protein GCM10010123_27580 [Pilimelia anulata]|uniref:DUF4360 domain-containing protein n=1 Tax=Pilimelia anulata TaxID=53371 RepID=A0A8J3B5U5_9ACTN|nr:DUF4360 domain-containing protein [Pilimelia anulata]GGJ96115.1 hypothetical protein GCM10010123_27580 [Pilimelia anulata]
MQLATRAAAVCAATAAVVAVAAPAAAGPDRRGPDRTPRPYGIEVLDLRGSGCADDTATVSLSNDNLALTVVYGDYSVELAAGQRRARKDCHISLRVRSPRGTQYAISSVDQRGFADLAGPVRGRFTADYHYARGRTVYRTARNFAPPVTDIWQDTASDLRYSRCGEDRPLHLDSSIELWGRGSDAATSFLAIDTTDADAAATTFGLRWRHCR